MECTSQPPQMPRQASKKGGRSGHGLRFRRGADAPEDVMQPKAEQRHAKPRARTFESRFRAHALRFHKCASGAASSMSKTDSWIMAPRTRIGKLQLD